MATWTAHDRSMTGRTKLATVCRQFSEYSVMVAIQKLRQTLPQFVRRWIAGAIDREKSFNHFLHAPLIAFINSLRCT